MGVIKVSYVVYFLVYYFSFFLNKYNYYVCLGDIPVYFFTFYTGPPTLSETEGR